MKRKEPIMAVMIARYERDKKLNVREEPSQSSAVVRMLSKGAVEEVKRIENGWCELEDGFAKAEFLIIEIGDLIEEPVSSTFGALDKKSKPIVEMESVEAVSSDTEDESAELRKMTCNQLYNLAEQSGIKVRKGMKKNELIAAILTDE